MKNSTTFIFLFLISFRAIAQLPAFEWANQCGNPPNTTDAKTSLASGQDGELYLSGEFLDTARFGNKVLVAAGGIDIFLVKYTAEGNVLWTNRIGAADDDYTQKIVVDNEGSVIVTGYFYGLIQIGQDQYTSYGSQDVFIAKYDSEGDFLWSYRAGGMMADYITGLAVDNEQNLVISGYFYDAITFDDTTLYSSSSSDVYLAKFDADGELLWVTSAGGSSSDQVRSVSCDPDGNVLVSGSFYYDITLGDTTLSTMDPAGVFIAKYFTDGLLDQAFQLNGTYLTPEVYIKAGEEGDFYISGNFSEQVVFGNKTFNAGEFNQDIYTAKYDPTCKLQWARHAYSYASDQVMGIETDSYNNLYLTGHYLDSIHFDLLSLPYTLCCGSREIFIVSYSAAGDVLWGDQITGTRANIQSVAMNGQDELLLSGLFTEEVIMGPLMLSHFEGFQNYVTCLRTEVFTSVNRDLNMKALKVFPNPASEKIQIMSGFNKGPFDYNIYSVNGFLIASGKVNINDTIDVGFLPSGTYYLRLNRPDEGSQSHSCLFIKQ